MRGQKVDNLGISIPTPKLSMTSKDAFLEDLRNRVRIYQLVDVPEVAAYASHIPKRLNIAMHVQDLSQDNAMTWSEKALGIGKFAHLESPRLKNASVVRYGEKMIVEYTDTTFIELMVLIMEHPLLTTEEIDSVDC